MEFKSSADITDMLLMEFKSSAESTAAYSDQQWSSSSGGTWNRSWKESKGYGSQDNKWIREIHDPTYEKDMSELHTVVLKEDSLCHSKRRWVLPTIRLR